MNFKKLRKRFMAWLTPRECSTCRHWSFLCGEFGKCEMEKDELKAYSDVCFRYRMREAGR